MLKGLQFRNRHSVRAPLRPAAVPDKPAANWRCPTISQSPANGSGRASLIFRKRMAKNSMPSRLSGFRYSLSYSVSDLKILEDHGSWATERTPAVTAKRQVPCFAERVSAVSLCRRDPGKESL